MTTRNSITVRAAAKVNLHLGVGAPREDGFHPLATVFQAIGLYDDLTATEAETWSVHTTADDGIDLATVPDGEDNIAVRAGRLLATHHGISRAAHLEIHKAIPVAGGMAGGSADAAAALVALDRLWALETTDEDLLSLAAQLGSDVPFALIGGTALGTGRGEVVTPVADATGLWWVVVPHEIGLSTPLVYRDYDRLAAFGSADEPAELLKALEAGDAEAVIGLLHNDLTRAAHDLRPDLARRAEELGDLGSVLLSGSGPTQLIAAPSVDRAREIAAELTTRWVRHWLAPAPVAGCHVL